MEWRHQQGIKTNKPMGIDTIPPKILVSLKEFISEPVKNIINLTVLEGCFLDHAKTSSITPAIKQVRGPLKLTIDQSVFFLLSPNYLKNLCSSKCQTILKNYFQNVCQDLEEDMAVSMF